jgi:hypothetical protein
MAYDPATAQAVIDTAVTNLRAERQAAKQGGADPVAAVIDAAIGDLRQRKQGIDAAAAITTWTMPRARDVLVTAGTPAGLTERGTVVALPSGAQLRIVPGATADARWSGYAILLEHAGDVVLTLRATDDADLTTTVQRLTKAAA